MSKEIYYSDNKINKPKKVIPLENYIIHIEYNDGKIIDYDMKPMLNHPLFKPLKDEQLFKLAKINGSAISWPGDIDICADSLYDTMILDNTMKTL